MAKTLSLEKILPSLPTLPLHDLLTLKDSVEAEIGKQEKDAQATIDKANEVINLIKNGK